MGRITEAINGITTPAVLNKMFGDMQTMGQNGGHFERML